MRASRRVPTRKVEISPAVLALGAVVVVVAAAAVLTVMSRGRRPDPAVEAAEEAEEEVNPFEGLPPERRDG